MPLIVNVGLQMGLFSKHKIEEKMIDGLCWQNDSRIGTWSCVYQDISFDCENAKEIPSQRQMDLMIKVAEDLAHEMHEKITKYLRNWSIESETIPSYSITVPGRPFDGGTSDFEVWFCDHEQWGDLGVEFGIKNGSVVYDVWGD